MKLLLFSDVHCDEKKCHHLVELSKEADLVICAGDVGLMRKGLNATIAILQAITPPTFLVPGNSESDAELEAACRNWNNATVLHGTGKEHDGYQFYGVGGGIPVTPFGAWSVDFSEAEATKLLADCPAKGILIVHSPPKGILDQSSTGHHLGSQAIHDTIITQTPRLVVCGHIHESSGKHSRVGTTDIVNAGPEGMFWTL